MKELQFAQFTAYLHARPREAHKGNFGHVLVIGGDQGYCGAVQLAALAALRVGAGLVSVATQPAHANTMNLMHPEIMCHGIHEAAELESLFSKATVVVAGPGLGRTSWSQTLFDAVLKEKKPLILDADGLNWLAEEPPLKRSNWILTPHPGEAARLLKKSTEDVQKNRLAAIKLLQHAFGGHIILKGSGSLIMGPDEAPMICTKGNPGMATAGMGDVLSGVLGGLAAQDIPLGITAKLGVLIHAMAGDLAATEGERGMMASDLMPYLRQLVNLEKGSQSSLGAKVC